jgi:hypothetical protein
MIPLACTAVLATAPIPPVSSDAPDYSNGTVTIPPGAVQAEVGVDVTLPGSGLVERQVPVHVPTTLRIGLTDKIELRLFEGEPVLVEDRNRRVGGDTAFGLKIRFNEYAPHTRKPSFGIQPFVEFATLRLAKDIDTLALGATLLWTQTVTRWLVFDANLGGELGVRERDIPFLGFAAISWQIVASERWIPYAELYVEMPSHAPETIDFGGDAGLVAVVRPRLALNAAARVTFLAEGADYGVLAGVAVRLADGDRWRRWTAKP